MPSDGDPSGDGAIDSRPGLGKASSSITRGEDTKGCPDNAVVGAALPARDDPDEALPNGGIRPPEKREDIDTREAREAERRGDCPVGVRARACDRDGDGPTGGGEGVAGDGVLSLDAGMVSSPPSTGA